MEVLEIAKALVESFTYLRPERFSVEEGPEGPRVFAHRGADSLEVPRFLWESLWKEEFGSLSPSRHNLELFLNLLPVDKRPLLPFLTREKAKALWDAIFPLMGKGVIPPELYAHVGRVIEVAEVIP
ncbi:hypothetical protein [Thermus sp.]|uniref:hypothetical protein n=1 Tax=Thermus sp. TaxID=275 RepID=UPI00260259BA|nr:hypothetical protein [Thermus sp.]MCX7849666.1 hypothetical protein [Thermus sp.]